MVGPYSKPTKVTALTRMIPYGESDDYSTGKAFNGIVPFSPDMLRLVQIDEESYIVPRKQINNLVERSDIEDWSHVLNKLNLLLGNMMRLLSNIRKQEYYRITYLKLEDKEIQRRHNLIKEKLLDRSADQEDVEAKTPITDREKIEQLKKSLIAMGFVGAAAAAAITDTAPLSGNVAQKAAQLAKRLMTDLGLTDYQAAGIVGNLLAEGFGAGKPNVIQGGAEGPPPPYGTMGVGYGWAQWTNGGNNGPEDRLNKFIIRLGGGPNKRGRPANDSDNYEYLLDDFRTGYASVISVLKQTTNVTDAARIILTKYERPLDQSEAVVRARSAKANSVLQEMKKAAGGIVIPELMDEHIIEYNTERKTTLLSNFIVDKPTIVNTKDVGEPLVIIPLERPIGRSILKMLFDKPFKTIERIFGKSEEQDKEPKQVNAQTPIQNSQTQINRTTIPETITQKGTTSGVGISPAPQVKTPMVSVIPTTSDDSKSTIENIDVMGEIISGITPVMQNNIEQKTRIDNVSQSVSDIFETEVLLLTQDITVIEE